MEEDLLWKENPHNRYTIQDHKLVCNPVSNGKNRDPVYVTAIHAIKTL